jgi:hypothetical protein
MTNGDSAGLDEKLENLLHEMDRFGDRLSDAMFGGHSWTPWLLALSTAVVACELARRQLRGERQAALGGAGPDDPSSWWFLVGSTREEGRP